MSAFSTPGGAPPTPGPRRSAGVLTPDRRTADVLRARDGVYNAETRYVAGRRRRGLAAKWQDFAHRYGWRAYALPMLAVVTVGALVSMSTVAGGQVPGLRGQHHGGQSGPTVPPTAASSMTLKHDAPAGNYNDQVLKSAALPKGAPYTVRGDGTFRVLRGSTPVVGSGHLYRYSVEVENGIQGVDVGAFQDMVVRTLSDPRSWAGHGVALQRVDSGPVDFHVSLTSSVTVRPMCGYDIHVETSCYARAGSGTNVNRVVLNVARWVRGSAAYVGDLTAYRTYMINHEVGHALGHMHAHECLPGGLAPVMMQQTFGLRSAATGAMCAANPWPYPPGAQGAPGAEQPDTPQNDEYGLSD